MTVHRIAFVLNGRTAELDVRAHSLLLDVLRDRLDQKGAKRSCDMQVTRLHFQSKSRPSLGRQLTR